MSKPKTDILEREHYTKYFLAVAFENIKTSNDLCRLEKRKTLRKTSENYSNFLKSLQQKQFLSVDRKFGKYYEYSVDYEGILKYLVDLLDNLCDFDIPDKQELYQSKPLQAVLEEFFRRYYKYLKGESKNPDPLKDILMNFIKVCGYEDMIRERQENPLKLDIDVKSFLSHCGIYLNESSEDYLLGFYRALYKGKAKD